jgi:hypothetical protein
MAVPSSLFTLHSSLFTLHSSLSGLGQGGLLHAKHQLRTHLGPSDQRAKWRRHSLARLASPLSAAYGALVQSERVHHVRTSSATLRGRLGRCVSGAGTGSSWCPRQLSLDGCTGLEENRRRTTSPNIFMAESLRGTARSTISAKVEFSAQGDRPAPPRPGHCGLGGSVCHDWHRQPSCRRCRRCSPAIAAAAASPLMLPSLRERTCVGHALAHARELSCSVAHVDASTHAHTLESCSLIRMCR